MEYAPTQSHRRAVPVAQVGVIAVWELTASQWDQHLARRTPYVRRTGLDCTHFCEPSGVMEAWVDAALFAIAAAAESGR